MFSKSIFASKTFWLNLLFALPQVMDLLASNPLVPPKYLPWVAMLQSVINILVRFATNGPVHLVNQVEVSQSDAGAAVVKKQAGYSMLSAVLMIAAASVMLLIVVPTIEGCQTLGLHQQTLDQSLLEAESTATAALQLSDQLLITKTITLATDQTVRRSHDVVIAAVHTGHAALSAGDPAKAQQELEAMQADIFVLTSFLSDHK